MSIEREIKIFCEADGDLIANPVCCKSRDGKNIEKFCQKQDLEQYFYNNYQFILANNQRMLLYIHVVKT